jgi:hypothetical protein
MIFNVLLFNLNRSHGENTHHQVIQTTEKSTKQKRMQVGISDDFGSKENLLFLLKQFFPRPSIAPATTDVDANNIMPMVTIRDPLIWLQSMCRHHYTAKWINPDPNHCPDFGDPERSFVTRVKYADFSRRHDSIVHHYNDYYNEYIELAKIPFLLVRFEDLVFHPEETTKTVCECAGGKMRRDGTFHYVVDSAKKGIGAHGKVR